MRLSHDIDEEMFWNQWGHYITLQYYLANITLQVPIIYFNEDINL